MIKGLRDDVARGLDDGWSRGVANGARGHGAGVLDAGEREHDHKQKC